MEGTDEEPKTVVENGAVEQTSGEGKEDGTALEETPTENGVDETIDGDDVAQGADKEGSTENEADTAEVKKTTAPESKEIDEQEGKVKKKPKKPLQKSIPSWATLIHESDTKKYKGLQPVSSANVAKPKMEELVVAAVKACADVKGNASAQSVKKYLIKSNPTWPKMLMKKALAKALEKKRIRQPKGRGFNGHLRIDPSYKGPVKKSDAKGKGKKEVTTSPREPLENVLPLVFTWACNPKEASVTLIKKYINRHYPKLDTTGVGFKKAILGAVKRGQLDQITGTGLSGTFQLVDNAKKSGGKYEDAFEDAIIAMNEPKDCSVTKMRDMLSVYHKEYNTDDRPRVLKNALERSEQMGWLTRITGKGFSGSYRLAFPYYPSPKELWGNEYNEDKERVVKERPARRKRKHDSSDEEDSESGESDEEDSDEEDSEDEDYSSDEEVIPSKKRGPPMKRSLPSPKKQIAAKKPKKAATSTKSVKKGRPIAKKAQKALVSKPMKGKAVRGRGRPKKKR